MLPWKYEHPWMSFTIIVLFILVVNSMINTMIKSLSPRKHCNGCTCEHHDED